jgi:peroxiredoxin Q/BCP
MLKTGELAPEINATTTDGSRFVLSEATESCTVVYFYPRAFTPGCTAEAEHFRDNRAEVLMAGAQIVGISSDDDATQCRFAEKIGTKFPLISDTNGAIAASVGVRWPIVGMARRVTFIVGEDRRIEAVFQHRSIVPFKPSNPLEFVDEVLAFLHRRLSAKARG